MSDPVTNIEIEDVLSSIRRLVVDEKGPVSGLPDRGWSDVRDRLVLTPSLRVREVSDGSNPDIQTDDCDVTDVQHREADRSVAEPNDSFADRPVQLSGDEAVVGCGADGENLDFSEVFAQLDGGSDDARASREQPSGDRTQRDEAGSSAPPWRDPESFLMKAAQLARQANAQTTPDSVPADILNWLNDTEEQPLGGAGDPERSTADDEAVACAGATPEPSAGTGLPPDLEGDVERPTPGLNVKPGALETDIANSRDRAPNTAVQTVPEERDANPFADDPEPVHEAVTDAADAQTGDPFPDILGDLDPEGVGAASLDQDALREMIADVVREELRGELGERITRNVRKLVRREINRALPTQGWD
ncbi:hypothetical protein [Sedimentitalea nanhaiensis]|uniref:DUF2497 domain-containing protein n=1 Tax=Sedimentitalea nanhaiensis TaxID=999627 RepID=A0A1I7BDE2_9RHOB|nr:hypothetical protein [Sedimentitalea nanhaiensis]SFT85141.1 hypothetical protein SAMN05216236_109104 [Sedimentitalea nanhaiensis]